MTQILSAIFRIQIQNSLFEKSHEQAKKPSGGAKDAETVGVDAREKLSRSARTSSVPLAYLLEACPLIETYARDGIKTWHDMTAAAGLVRSMLGISPDAWHKAQADFGETGAAIVIAAILERAEDIRSPGGYLRSLSEKARAGKFSVWPMLEALHARK